MQVDPAAWGSRAAEWATSNARLAITGVLVLVALAWAYDAYEDADGKGDALKGFAGNAASGTGGVLNVILVSIVAFVGWAATSFQTAGEAVVWILTLVPDAPVLAASVFTISLGALGLSDLIVLRAWHFLALTTAVVVLALAYRTDFGEVSLR